MMTAPARNQSLPASPYSITPSGQLSALSVNPIGIGETISQWKDWWTHWVSAGYSDWDSSIDAIRLRFDEWIDDPETTFPGKTEFNKQRDLLVERYGDCYTAWYVWPYSAVGAGCVHVGDVSAVMTCYNNLLHKGFPEFYYATTTIEQRDALYRAIAACSGVDYEIVWPLMVIAKHTFDTTGKVHASVMYPITWEHHKENRKTVAEEDTILGYIGRAATDVGAFAGDLLTFLKWAVIVAGIGFAGYYGYKIFIETRSSQ